jgi:hypothetical protein
MKLQDDIVYLRDKSAAEMRADNTDKSRAPHERSNKRISNIQQGTLNIQVKSFAITCFSLLF